MKPITLNFNEITINPSSLGPKVRQNHWISFILIGATKLSQFGKSRYNIWNTFHTYNILVVNNGRLLFKATYVSYMEGSILVKGGIFSLLLAWTGGDQIVLFQANNQPLNSNMFEFGNGKRMGLPHGLLHTLFE